MWESTRAPRDSDNESRHKTSPMIFRPSPDGRLVCERRDAFSPEYAQFAHSKYQYHSARDLGEEVGVPGTAERTEARKFAHQGMFGIGRRDVKRNFYLPILNNAVQLGAQELLTTFGCHGVNLDEAETHSRIESILSEHSFDKAIGRKDPRFVEETEPIRGRRQFLHRYISRHQGNAPPRHKWANNVTDRRVWGVGRPPEKE